MNNSLSNKLDAQLGINPIIVENKGVRYLFINKKFAKFSSPTAAIINPKEKLITKTYANISNA
jgi:hypothetical protein